MCFLCDIGWLLVFRGKPQGDINVLNVSNDWEIINIDDEYEIVNNRQRWMWNLTKTKIIHEFVVESSNKTDKSRQFMSGSDVFELLNDIVKKSSISLIRTENQNGDVVIEAKNTNKEFPRL